MQQKIDLDNQATALQNVLHGMIAKAKDGILMMPTNIAQRILDDLNFPRQRTEKPNRTLKHLARIKTGVWRGSFPITFVILPDGRMYLVDGQHRLAAIIAHGTPVPIRVLVDKVSGEDEAARTYAGFDEPTSGRTSNEVLDAIGITEQMGLKRDTTTSLFNALPLLMNSLEPTRGAASIGAPLAHSMDCKIEEITEWKSEAARYEAAIQKAPMFIRRKLRGAGCLAVALYTFRHQPGRAEEFWEGLALNDGLRKGDPRSTLIADMFERKMNSGSSRQAVQQPALAWNAWNEKRDLKIIKCITGAPITLWGTPLAKGR